MDEILGQVLRNAVWERLDMLAELSAKTGDELVAVARSELPKLTDGWRELLAAHEPDAKGNCPECSSRWRQQSSPCPIWRAAYEHLVGGALAARPSKATAVAAKNQPNESTPVNPSANTLPAQHGQRDRYETGNLGMRRTAGAAY